MKEKYNKQKQYSEIYKALQKVSEEARSPKMIEKGIKAEKELNRWTGKLLNKVINI